MFPNKQFRGGQGGAKKCGVRTATLLAKMRWVYTGALLAQFDENCFGMGEAYMMGVEFIQLSEALVETLRFSEAGFFA